MKRIPSHVQTVEVCCAWCKKKFMARVADRKRGWGRFCSKSCKAKEQEKRTGQYAAYQAEQMHREGMEAVEAGWDGHKNVF